MPPLLSEAPRESGARPGSMPAPHGLAIGPDGDLPPTARRRRTSPSGAMSLHVSKLRGMTDRVRARLKRQGITYTDQLLEAIGRTDSRRQLAARCGIEAALLERLACRADLTRIKGVGAIFADMLELLGVDRSVRLARQDAGPAASGPGRRQRRPASGPARADRRGGPALDHAGALAAAPGRGRRLTPPAAGSPVGRSAGAAMRPLAGPRARR